MKETINFQNQPCNVSCVSTVIAMILNKPVCEIVEQFDEKYHSDQLSQDEFLRENGRIAEKYFTMHRCFAFDKSKKFIDYECFFSLTVPSLNVSGGGHCILIHWNGDGEGCLYDPQRGREGMKYYVWGMNAPDDRDHLQHDLMSYSIDYIVKARLD